MSRIKKSIKDEKIIEENITKEIIIDKTSFEWIGANASDSESISRPSTSYWRDAMHRLSKNKAAMVCLGFCKFTCGPCLWFH